MIEFYSMMNYAHFLVKSLKRQLLRIGKLQKGSYAGKRKKILKRILRNFLIFYVLSLN